MKSVLLICDSISSFVKSDIEILEKNFRLKVVLWRGWGRFINTFKGIISSDINISWFACNYAAFAVFFSKLFGKKSIIIVGGWDVACLPEIKYGRFALDWFTRLLTRFALKYSSGILVVDPGLIDGIESNAKIFRKDIVCIPTGYDSGFWKPQGVKQDIVMTVAISVGDMQIALKGLNLFIHCAKYFPQIKFIIIGAEKEAALKLKQIAGNNVDIIGFQNRDSLRLYYQSAKVYCQFSMDEGLPNSLCEAMLCECIPVGTDIPGIRSAIGKAGFYIQDKDPEKVALVIGEALKAPAGLENKARERIKDIFPLEKRENLITSFIADLCGHK